MPARSRKTMGLLSFLRGSSDPKDGTPGCANYDHHYGGCLFSEKCNVAEGQRCSYFEAAVLPVAFRIGCEDSLINQYQKQVKDVVRVQAKEARRCNCGQVLKPRQQFCDKCIKQRRRKQYRAEKQKQRISCPTI